MKSIVKNLPVQDVISSDNVLFDRNKIYIAYNEKNRSISKLQWIPDGSYKFYSLKTTWQSENDASDSFKEAIDFILEFEGTELLEFNSFGEFMRWCNEVDIWESIDNVSKQREYKKTQRVR